MTKRNGFLAATAILILGTTACAPSASGEKDKVPSSATSREDIEKIIHAYIMDNPEIILQSVDNLAKRQQAESIKLASVALENNPKDFTIGPADAPVTIVEYFDYNCSVCKFSLDWVQTQIKNGDGKIRFVFKEFPIFGEQSENAALASLAAKEQGKYFEYHQALMKEKAHTLTQEKLEKAAVEVGLDLARFQSDMKSEALKTHLEDTMKEGIAFGVEATPYFFINGKLIPGFDPPSLQARIDEVLEEAK